MGVWAENFLWAGLIAAFLCWWVTRLVWFDFKILLPRIVVALVATITLMHFVGGFLAFFFQWARTGNELFGAISQDLTGAIAYFRETGLETSIFWLPVMLLRIVLLAFERRPGRQHQAR